MFHWTQLSSVGRATSHLMPSTWPYDKYPEAPELDAGKTVTLIDEAGPGVVSCLHVSDYYDKRNILEAPPGGAGAAAASLVQPRRQAGDRDAVDGFPGRHPV